MNWKLRAVIALILLVVGSVAWSVISITQDSQHTIEANETERAAAGQTAVFEFDLTQSAP